MEIQSKADSKGAPEGIEPLGPSDIIDENVRLHAEIESAKDEFTVSEYYAKQNIKIICYGHHMFHYHQFYLVSVHRSNCMILWRVSQIACD